MSYFIMPLIVYTAGMISTKEPSKSTHHRVYRRIAAETRGKALQPGEVVHHKNFKHTDNRPENLEIMSTKEHSYVHGVGARMKRYKREARAKIAQQVLKPTTEYLLEAHYSGVFAIDAQGNPYA
jgi:hypothetical protein